MALLYRAELHPSKLELVAAWAPSQPWFDGDGGSEFLNVASYRFDDPDGEVGIETLLIRAGAGPVLQVPLTYRNAPLAGGEGWLVGTMEHSVLGKRWTYDATGDPVYVAAVARAILTGGSQAEQWIEIDGKLVQREPTAVVAGSGAETVDVSFLDQPLVPTTRQERGLTLVEAGNLLLEVIRTPQAPHTDAGFEVLTGTWTDHPEPTTLVRAKTNSRAE